ncbi:MAG: amino acid permease, partial [Flavobacteriales bacterium]|nr:amino acid permease [Flavobacteriales bacterium]
PLNDLPVLIGVLNASVLAVFAFIGFEDMVNVSEETKNPKRNMPIGILLTILITTVLYSLVATVAVLTVDPVQLAQSDAPLTMVFEQVSTISPSLISAIAIFATANTILVQFIMASRVIYGLAAQNESMKPLAHVNPITRTPIRASLIVIAITLTLALAFDLENLAEMASRLMLVIWTFINLALVRIKMKGITAPEGALVVSIWVPALGAILCILFVIISLFV